MADVMDVAAAETLEPRQQNSRLENHENDLDGSPPPPPPRRRERESRERRDDRDAERPPNRRDRSPPPPPPPPTGAARGERDWDYRRRSSPSPPYSHRDMRRSPPRRSPPPFGAKRSRRDDGGYDRRRGSPRGGFGDDRRYDYDYSGPGGRSAYADDRFSGRHSRASDWPDSGRFDSSIGVIKREGLMSYKQFIQELEDDILPAEAQRRYEEYRSEYVSTQKHAFFEAHKEEEWLKDKYHPTNLVSVIERRNLHAKEIAKEFLLDLQNGTLDLGPGKAAPISKPGHSSAPSSDDEAGPGDKRRRNGKGVMKDSDLSTAPKAHPVSSESRRIQVDIELAQALVVKLDSEKGVEENILSNSDRKKFEGDKSRDGLMGPIIIIRGMTTVRGLEGVELLDTLITYLWRIHGIDYYGLAEKTEPKGLRHVRSEEKGYDGTNKAVGDWEKKLESFWQERLQRQDPLELMMAKDKIDAAALEVLDPYVRKIRDEKYGWKYGCGAKGCTKLFHAAEYVHKHLRLKHEDLVMELTSKVRDDLYLQNYMNDPDAPGGTPVMQQPALKERLATRRPISDRLRDDRGSRRGYEDRYDKSEKSPSHGPDGENPDDPMYDAYDGQGLHGAPFPSDMPHPPVLMPVPGAGPLGPFVPAPPDVAMRLLREQGGPPPFDGSNGRGRKGQSGPSPILMAPPALPHDRRRMRSYQDLDAAEDEVTILDYRSL